MGAKDNVKSGGVIPFDHKDKEKTNHDKAQAWHQRLRACASQNLTPELVHVLFSAQIDGAKANWGYAGLPAFKTWKNNYINIFKPGERPKKPSKSVGSLHHTYKTRVLRWKAQLEKYEEKYRTFAQKKQKAYAKLAEAQAWLYNQVDTSFSETDSVCIKRYEPSVL